MAENIERPIPVGWDKLHALVRGVLASTPIAGGVAAEFFNFFVKPPLLKKQERVDGPRS
jgi:hypothetical protein